MASMKGCFMPQRSRDSWCQSPALFLPFLVGLVLPIGACDRSGNDPLGPNAGATAVADGRSVVFSPAQEALEQLGRATALALADRGLRQRIAEDMQASPYREHKLALSSYLAGSSGGILKAKLRSLLDSSTDVDALITAAPSLEFYLPLERDRLTWHGDAPPLVATQIDDDDDIVAFTTAGERLLLDPTTPPDDVVLSLVPVETDFDTPATEMQLLGGSGITGVSTISGTLAQVCQDPEICGGGGGGGSGGGGGTGGGGTSFWQSVSNGVWIDGAYISDLHESWTKGEPEIEVFTLFDPILSGEGIEINCVAESKFGELQYVQNDHVSTDRARLATQEQLDQSGDPPGLAFVIYEDDDTTCEIVDDNTNFENVATAAGTLTGGAYAATQAAGPLGPVLVAAAAGFTILANLPNWINTNDDIIGMAIINSCEILTKGSTITGNRTIIGEGGSVEGCATIILNTEGT